MRNSIKIKALALLFCLIAQEAVSVHAFSFSHPSQTSLPGPLSSLPSDAGSVEDVYFTSFGPDKKIVYLLQDAHANQSAQISQAKILEHLHKNLINKSTRMRTQKSPLIFLEGGVGDVSLSYLSRFASTQKRKQVARTFLTKGLIQGADYFSLTMEDPIVLRGMEDAGAYKQSLLCYQTLYTGRGVIQKNLDQLERASDFLKKRLSPDLLWHLSIFSPEEQGRELSKWDEKIKLLQGIALVEGLDLKKYPLIRRVSRVKNASSEGPKKIAVGWKGAGAKRLLFEYERLGEALMDKLAYSPHDKHILKLLNQIRVVKKLFLLSLDSGEFLQVLAAVKEYDWAALTAEINTTLMQSRLSSAAEAALLWDGRMQKYFAASLKFYELTLRRDEFFIKHILSEWKNADRPYLAAVIGGFHTRNLSKLLREKNISYAVITPQVKYKTSKADYEAVLLEQLKTDRSTLAIKPGGCRIAPEGKPVRSLLAGALGRKTAARLASRKPGDKSISYDLPLAEKKSLAITFSERKAGIIAKNFFLDYEIPSSSHLPSRESINSPRPYFERLSAKDVSGYAFFLGTKKTLSEEILGVEQEEKWQEIFLSLTYPYDRISLVEHLNEDRVGLSAASEVVIALVIHLMDQIHSRKSSQETEDKRASQVAFFQIHSSVKHLWDLYRKGYLASSPPQIFRQLTKECEVNTLLQEVEKVLTEKSAEKKSLEMFETNEKYRQTYFENLGESSKRILWEDMNVNRDPLNHMVSNHEPGALTVIDDYSNWRGSLASKKTDFLIELIERLHEKHQKTHDHKRFDILLSDSFGPLQHLHQFLDRQSRDLVKIVFFKWIQSYINDDADSSSFYAYLIKLKVRVRNRECLEAFKFVDFLKKMKRKHADFNITPESKYVVQFTQDIKGPHSLILGSDLSSFYPEASDSGLNDYLSKNPYQWYRWEQVRDTEFADQRDLYERQLILSHLKAGSMVPSPENWYLEVKKDVSLISRTRENAIKYEEKTRAVGENFLAPFQVHRLFGGALMMKAPVTGIVVFGEEEGNEWYENVSPIEPDVNKDGPTPPQSRFFDGPDIAREKSIPAISAARLANIKIVGNPPYWGESLTLEIKFDTHLSDKARVYARVGADGWCQPGSIWTGGLDSGENSALFLCEAIGDDHLRYRLSCTVPEEVRSIHVGIEIDDNVALVSPEDDGETSLSYKATANPTSWAAFYYYLQLIEGPDYPDISAERSDAFNLLSVWLDEHLLSNIDQDQLNEVYSALKEASSSLFLDETWRVSLLGRARAVGNMLGSKLREPDEKLPGTSEDPYDRLERPDDGETVRESDSAVSSKATLKDWTSEWVRLDGRLKMLGIGPKGFREKLLKKHDHIASLVRGSHVIYNQVFKDLYDYLQDLRDAHLFAKKSSDTNKLDAITGYIDDHVYLMSQWIELCPDAQLKWETVFQYYFDRVWGAVSSAREKLTTASHLSDAHRYKFDSILSKIGHECSRNERSLSGYGFKSLREDAHMTNYEYYRKMIQSFSRFSSQLSDMKKALKRLDNSPTSQNIADAIQMIDRAIHFSENTLKSNHVDSPHSLIRAESSDGGSLGARLAGSNRGGVDPVFAYEMGRRKWAAGRNFPLSLGMGETRFYYVSSKNEGGGGAQSASYQWHARGGSRPLFSISSRVYKGYLGRQAKRLKPSLPFLLSKSRLRDQGTKDILGSLSLDPKIPLALKIDVRSFRRSSLSMKRLLLAYLWQKKMDSGGMIFFVPVGPHSKKWRESALGERVWSASAESVLERFSHARVVHVGIGNNRRRAGGGGEKRAGVAEERYFPLLPLNERSLPSLSWVDTAVALGRLGDLEKRPPAFDQAYQRMCANPIPSSQMTRLFSGQAALRERVEYAARPWTAKNAIEAALWAQAFKRALDSSA